VFTALLLDVDDTLIDTRVAMVAAGEAAAAVLWPQAGAAVHHAAGLRFQADPGDLFGRFTRGQMSFPQMRQARVADLLETFSLAMIDEVDDRFESAYAPAFASKMRRFDDVVPFVEAVSAAGIPVGLLTNSSLDYTSQKLELTGLAGVFAVVVTRDTLGFGKPDARAFHHACRLMGSAPPETLYVGDHLEIDAIGARNAGLGAVWLQRNLGETSDRTRSRNRGDTPDLARARAHGIPVVTSLSQVPALLPEV
jgi:putative hydrolase of the HAD superfamily